MCVCHPSTQLLDCHQVGYTCLLIASKYEEREPVVINDLVALMNEVPVDKRDRTYTRVDLLRIEQHILM